MKAPVVITHHRRRRLVMLSVEEFDRLRENAKPQAYPLHSLDDETVLQIASSKMSGEHNELDKLMYDE